MKNDAQIKTFVQGTLGCGCPEEVFAKIETSQLVGDEVRTRINIGDRLLIYIVTADGELDLEKVVVKTVEQGIQDRNQNRFNRFRLVVGAAEPEQVTAAVTHGFSACSTVDELAHLHILPIEQLNIF